MNRTDQPGWTGTRAQLHDAARAARQVADDRETIPSQPLPTATHGAATGPGAPAPAPAGPGTSHPPSHPVTMLTAAELRDYRRDLEHALKNLPVDAPVRDLLHRQLAAVRAEQESRARDGGPARQETGQ